MKTYLFLIATAITLGFISCSEEDCNHLEEGQPDIVGSWYEEVYNEEVRYDKNGTFYDRFSNVLRCNEVEGLYEFDYKNKKLTYRSLFSGDNKVTDWTVVDFSEFGFVISSNIGRFNLEKIVESYNLEVGESTTILFDSEYPSYAVQSYCTNNERLATVTSNGVITAVGEKGTTYIKLVTNQGNVWVKVVVGDDCEDLWYDYVSMIGMDYEKMKKTLGLLGEPINGEDGYSFIYENPTHDVVPVMLIKMNPSNGIINDVRLVLKEGVPESRILSYLDSRYYKFDESNDKNYYSTLSNKEDSKAIVIYDKSNRIVFIEETNEFFNPPIVDLWSDLTSLFGANDVSVKTKMDEYEYPYLMTDNSYSVNGSDYYQILGNEYANMVGFVFNPDNVVSEYWVYLNKSSDPNSVYSYLQRKYEKEESESTDKLLVFYNEDKTIKIMLDLNNATVVYTNLTLKQHETQKVLWSDYTIGLGKTAEQLMEKYGEPYCISEDKTTYYYKFSDSNLELCSFVFYKGSKDCTHVALFHKNELPYSYVVEYLSSIYTVYKKGTSADGSEYKWINSDSLEKSTIGITYYPEDKNVIYQSLK